MAELRKHHGCSWEINLTFVKEKKKKTEKKRQVSSSCGIRTLIFGHHSIMGCMKAVLSSIMMQDNPVSVGIQ